ncbi:hypothetical protein [Paenibacillus sp. sgz302251]|uniref:hypothetical protein n=1 Tax=Paenibacillus sp. sgz302251 TaxID=3414493 RepID=UPI003C7AF7A0
MKREQQSISFFGLLALMASVIVLMGCGVGNLSDVKVEAAVRSGTGTYTGMADSHTIEVMMNGEARTYQLSEGLSEFVETLDTDTRIWFDYTSVKMEWDDTVILQTLTSIQTTDPIHIAHHTAD